MQLSRSDRPWISAIFSLALSVLPLDVRADPALPDLESLFPGDTVRWGVAESPMDGKIDYRDLRWRGAAFDLGAQRLSLQREKDGRLLIEAKGLVLRSHAENGPVLSVSSASLVLDDNTMPNLSEATACDLVPAVARLRILDLFIEFPADFGHLFEKFDLQDVYFDRKPGESPCALRGVAGTGLAEVQFSDGSDLLAMKTAFQFSAPLSRDALKATETASLRAALSGVEYRGLGEIPAFGFPETSFALDASEDSLGALFYLMSSASFWTPSETNTLDLMQGWNALTDIDGRLVWKAPVLRLYTPGVVPEALIANFSRAGLSTLSGSADLELFLKDRLLDLEVQGGFTGLFDAELTAEAVALPYSKEKLGAALKGAELGFHVVPDLRFGSARLSYQDKGLDMASNDILGVPAGRQVEELSANLRSRVGDAASQNLARVFEALALFFRTAAEGERLMVEASSPEPISLVSIFHLMLTDPAGLAKDANLSLQKLLAP